MGVILKGNKSHVSFLVWNIFGGIKSPRRHKIEQVPEAILTLRLALMLD